MSTTDLPINLHDYEQAARALLSPMVHGYITGGSEDEITLRANREAFDGWRFLPRMLSGLPAASTATTVLGQDVSMPILISPSGLHRVAHDEGELATARAAKAAGTIYTMSTAATIVMEEVSQEAGPWWFQLYILVDRGLTRSLVERAKANGASALVVTVDVPVLGRREADERNRFELPPGLTVANLRSPDHAHMPAGASGSGLTSFVGAAWDPRITWADLEWLAEISGLPVIPKGILHPRDAVLAFEHGAAAILVSNHGGRQLDGAIASLDALPAVVDAVGDRGEVLVDGGFRRGTDVLKALALGARAALIARPIYWGLSVAGSAGVQHVLELLKAELALDLLLCGLGSPAEVTRELLVPVGPLMRG